MHAIISSYSQFAVHYLYIDSTVFLLGYESIVYFRCQNERLEMLSISTFGTIYGITDVFYMSLYEVATTQSVSKQVV